MSSASTNNIESLFSVVVELLLPDGRLLSWTPIGDMRREMGPARLNCMRRNQRAIIRMAMIRLHCRVEPMSMSLYTKMPVELLTKVPSGTTQTPAKEEMVQDLTLGGPALSEMTISLIAISGFVLNVSGRYDYHRSTSWFECECVTAERGTKLLWSVFVWSVKLIRTEKLASRVCRKDKRDGLTTYREFLFFWLEL